MQEFDLKRTAEIFTNCTQNLGSPPSHRWKNILPATYLLNGELWVGIKGNKRVFHFAQRSILER